MIYEGRQATIIGVYQAPLIELRKPYTKFAEYDHLLKEKDRDSVPAVLDYCLFADETMKAFFGGDITRGLLETGKPKYDEIDVLGVSQFKDRLINELKEWRERMSPHKSPRNFSLEELLLGKIGESNNFIYSVDNILRFQFPPKEIEKEVLGQMERLPIHTSPINLYLIEKRKFDDMVSGGRIFYRG